MFPLRPTLLLRQSVSSGSRRCSVRHALCFTVVRCLASFIGHSSSNCKSAGVTPGDRRLEQTLAIAYPVPRGLHEAADELIELSSRIWLIEREGEHVLARPEWMAVRETVDASRVIEIPFAFGLHQARIILTEALKTWPADRRVNCRRGYRFSHKSLPSLFTTHALRSFDGRVRPAVAR